MYHGGWIPLGRSWGWLDGGRHKRLWVFWEGRKDRARSPAHRYARGTARSHPAPLSAEASLVLVVFCTRGRAAEPARTDMAWTGNGGETGGREAFPLTPSDQTP